MAFVAPENWSKTRLKIDLEMSADIFSKSRGKDEVRYYSLAFDDAKGKVDELLEVTDDLEILADSAERLFGGNYLDTIRYLTSPPISKDDLKNLARLPGLSASILRNVDNAEKAMQIIENLVDPKRFPWLEAGRKATDDEREKAAMATAVLMAAQETQTRRRTQARTIQENLVAECLEAIGYKETMRRNVDAPSDAPKYLEYCRETSVAGKKTDLVAGLPDGRFLCIECKVSNSEVNSFKRLNHETVEKVTHWDRAFGRNGVVGVAVLSGVFKLSNLEDAQRDGVAIFWAHDLRAMQNFIGRTESGMSVR